VPFAAFAGRTIEGEIKRYFRDATWSVRVPRSAKELHLAVRATIDVLSAELGRAPDTDEVAERLEISRDDVLVGLAAADARHIGSIGVAADDGTPIAARLASAGDGGYGHADDRSLVADLLATLPERERRIIELRFNDGLSQSEIAERIGVSQMHVSRLLRAALGQLREAAGELAP